MNLMDQEKQCYQNSKYQNWYHENARYHWKALQCDYQNTNYWHKREKSLIFISVSATNLYRNYIQFH